MSNIKDLSLAQLKRAIEIREEIESLEQQLASLGGSRMGRPPGSGAAKSSRGGKRRMSAKGRASIAAAARARWAKFRRGNDSAPKPAKKAKRFNAAARAKLSAAAKARWAKAKASGKSTL